MKASRLIPAVSVVAVASAQQDAWAQCGGSNWNGGTTCVAGSYCASQNLFYSQCIPGTGSRSSTSTKGSSWVASSPTTTSTVASASTIASTSRSSTSSGAAATPTGIIGYARASGGVFTVNGRRGCFMGTNTYYIGFLNNNADIDLVMSHHAASGLKVLRVWGFNDVATVPSGDSTPVINTGANGLQRLDYVVRSAEAHGISLIINFVNNWDDFGGITAYATFTESRGQLVVARYESSTAVFAWELANEPRCNGCDTSVLTGWIASTSAYVKSLDSNHMVCIGDEGFGLNGDTDTTYPYSDGEGLNFTANLAISTIDFGTYHAYPGSWGETDAWVPWIQTQ
ncbi:hypothetical protein B2J93_6908 [Marssonina coronariae]|uniref:mannan endo-1,4-beta-mannosidase n=1 Tax=Diplocarpon coronariae TaxID=2795749 RepID=A0A218YWL5_9HELO|nr:hypothetical protein B2J93_6908 [Marssonina coronariae]